MANWFNEQEQHAWDLEIEQNFTPGGLGEFLIQKIEADIATGKFESVEENCAERQHKLPWA